MIASVVFGAVVLYIVWKLLFQGRNEAVSKLPGPPRLPIFGNALLFVGKSPQKVFEELRQLNKSYGDRYVIRIPLNLWIINIVSPKDMEIALSHSRNIQKSLPYKFIEPWLGTGLLNSTGQKWHTRRKILTPTFHFNILKNFARVMEEKTQHFVTELKKSNGDAIDINKSVTNFTLHTICETAMGTRLDSDKSTAALQYKNAVLSIGNLIIDRLFNFWKHPDFIYNMTPAGNRFKIILKTVLGFADDVIKKRKKERAADSGKSIQATIAGEDVGNKRRLAMLDLLLEAESKGEIDNEGIREEVNTFMFEGHDTTSIALTFAFMLLSEHEDVQQKIFEECENIFEGTDRAANINDLVKMKYIEAVIKESLRMYPSVPEIGRVITEDFMLGDVLVKKGMELGIHIYDMHHNADLFPEPEVFNPDRFLDGTTIPPYAYLPFSAGPRNCIGQRFAMQEMKYAISEVSRAFKLRPAQPGFRPKLMTDLVLRTKDSIFIHFDKRAK